MHPLPYTGIPGDDNNKRKKASPTDDFSRQLRVKTHWMDGILNRFSAEHVMGELLEGLTVILLIAIAGIQQCHQLRQQRFGIGDATILG